MNKYTIILILFFSVKTSAAQFQELGIIFGPSITQYSHKTNKVLDPLDFGVPSTPPFDFHIGLRARYQMTSKWSHDIGIIYGIRTARSDKNNLFLSSILIAQHKGDADILEWSTAMKFSYLAIPVILHYELIPKLRVGLGIEPTHYYTPKHQANDNSGMMDMPIVGQITYQLWGLELSAAYKHGVFNLIKNKETKSLYFQDIQFSFYIPLYNQERYKERAKQRRERKDREIEAMEDEHID